jgi:translation elongation factor EF-Ts
MHIAASKPTYLGKQDVPKELRDKWYDEGKDKMLKKMYGVEVFLEQELATSDEAIKVSKFIAEKEKELGGRLSI